MGRGEGRSGQRRSARELNGSTLQSAAEHPCCSLAILGGLWDVACGFCVRRCGRSPGPCWGAGKGLGHSIRSMWASLESWDVWSGAEWCVLQLFPRLEWGLVCCMSHRPLRSVLLSWE